MDRSRRRLLLSAIACCALGIGCDAGGGPVMKIPDSPDGTVTAIYEGLASSQPQVVWDALPARYQQDVTFLVHEFGKKFDAELYDKVFDVARKGVALLKNKKDLLLKMSAEHLEPDQKKDVQKTFPAMVQSLEFGRLGLTSTCVAAGLMVPLKYHS